MRSRYLSRTVMAGIGSLVALTACQLREPFQANVIAAGADGTNVKVGIFNEVTELPALEDGTVPLATLDVDIASGRAVLLEADSVEIEPLQLDDQGVGHTTIDLLKDGPVVGGPIKVFAWSDVDGDGRLDLSNIGDSETARTVYRYMKESGKKAQLWSYNYNPNDGDPFYTATALTGPAENVIVTEDFLEDWMSVLPSDTEGLPPAADSDGDGLDDRIEARLGTSIYDTDTDIDGEDDATEVGDPAAPTDTDGDGLIDAVESSDDDFDADGLSAEADGDDFDRCIPSDDECDDDNDALSNAVERTIGTSPVSADTDGDTIDDATEVGDPAAPWSSDADGVIDALDTDSDGDGVPDATEGVADDDFDGVPGYRDADET